MRSVLFISVILLSLQLNTSAQDFHMPQASPTVSVNQGFSTSFIKLEYSRPSMRGRTIFGQLLPYGDLWRTGANQATKITFGEDVYIDGQEIKAGSYAIYTIPGENEWTIIFNKGTDNWGSSGYKKSEDVLRFNAAVHHPEHTYETFSIRIENITNNSCNLVLNWENTKLVIPIEVHNNERIMAYLDKKLKSDKPPYAAAADYYLETNQKLDDALKYISMAIKENPKAFHLYWAKAQIYQKLGQHKKAVAAAKKSAEKAKGSAFEVEYAQHYKHIQTLK
ncbi:MAG TPA: DUF2911 domain-containing protein [Chitinophagaceae bacterium]|nr:DUF2911 domain-containing protein [Chitinophagaceae bacterium]